MLQALGSWDDDVFDAITPWTAPQLSYVTLTGCAEITCEAACEFVDARNFEARECGVCMDILALRAHECADFPEGFVYPCS